MTTVSPAQTEINSVLALYFNGQIQEALGAVETLTKSYAEAAPSPDSYSFYAGILEKNGDVSGAVAMRNKAFELETDPLKKAKTKLKFAYAAKSRGQKGKARSLAREALRVNTNYGKE